MCRKRSARMGYGSNTRLQWPEAAPGCERNDSNRQSMVVEREVDGFGPLKRFQRIAYSKGV